MASGASAIAGWQVEELEDPLDPGPGLLADRQDAGQLPGGRHELGDVGRERQERAERDLVLQGQPAAEGEDRDLTERSGSPRAAAGSATAAAPRASASRTRLGRGGDPLELALLLAERLDDPDAVDVLVDDLGDVALALLAVPGGRKDPPAHAVGHDEQARRDDRR